MSIDLQSTIPLGRSFEEYKCMFNLSKDDLARKILDCGSGPACFDAVMNSMGNNVTSVDPLYEYSTAQYRTNIVQSGYEFQKGANEYLLICHD